MNDESLNQEAERVARQVRAENPILVAVGRKMAPQLNEIFAAMTPEKSAPEGAQRCAECDCENGGDECTWISSKPASGS